MDVRVDDKVVIITGGSRGIGEATAVEFLASGARGVLITSRKPDNAAEAVERLGGGERVASFVGSADKVEDVAGAVAAAISTFGACDIAVANAGTNPSVGPLNVVDLGAVDKTWSVNQRGPLLLAREAWNQWMGEHGGSIVMTASVAGMGPSPFLGAYNVSKAALIHLTRQLALEMAPRVRVNAVSPAVVKTRLAEGLWRDREEAVANTHPLKRLGEPEDIARAIVFLASDAAAWITGVNLPVDGGATGASASTAVDVG